MDICGLNAVISPVGEIHGVIDTGSAYTLSGDHTELIRRDAADQHPISAITGLQAALDAKGSYSMPSGGIPASDLSEAVRSSLARADSALQAHQSLAGLQSSVIADEGSYFGTDTVEAALQELGAGLSGKQAAAAACTVVIAAADWQGGTLCTKSVPGVTASCIVICDCSDSDVQCTAQGAGTLSFTATVTPSSAVTVKAVILP